MKLTSEESDFRRLLLRGDKAGIIRLAKSLGCVTDDQRNYTLREWPGILADRIIAARRKPQGRGAA